jgi:hypothetical protein
MPKMLTKKVPKSSKNFHCKVCDYFTSRESQYDRHVLTRKHKMLTNVDILVPNNLTAYFQCECGKTYKHRQSLSLHKKKCLKNLEESKDFTNISLCKTSNNEDILKEDTIKEDTTKSEDLNVKDKINTLENLVNENNDIKKLLIEQQKQLLEQQKQIGELIPKIGNTINNTANVEQKFNINVFLNEQCKDAITLDDFIKSIQVTLQQLDYIKTKGLANGLSNVILENINAMSIFKRPLHCTDLKRETLYINQDGIWKKDENNEKIKRAINNVSNKQYKALSNWVQENPDYNNDENKQNYYAKTLSIIGKPITNIDDKIIKNICNKTYVKKKINKL